MKHGPTQTGDVGRVMDGCGEPSAPNGVTILVTVPASQDVAYEARPMFYERPSRARLRGGNPARKCSAFGTRRLHGRIKCRRVSDEFGKNGSPCEHVCEAPRAPRHERCARDARSESRGRHGKPRRVRVHVTSSARTLRRELRVSSTLAHVGNPSNTSTYCNLQGDVKAACIAR